MARRAFPYQRTFSLPFEEPYDLDALLGFLGARAIPGVEQVEGGVYRRTVAVDGAVGVVEVRRAGRRGRLGAALRLSRPVPTGPLLARIRRLFDLDADSAAIDAHLAADPLLAAGVAARPGLRVPGAWEPFELVVRAILGQQISVAAARTLAGRIAARLGAAIGGADPTLARVFPGPAAIAAADPAGFGLPRARAAALRGIARAVREDPALLQPAGDLEATISRLDALPGIGRWTAHYVAMRALREPDAFPEGDLGLARALARGGVPCAPAAMLRRAERWRPWRAYAALHLWAGTVREP
jgi:AraC family transcriptional regulator of adaptative response / DNA-3-methyladenine glycosylase II